MLLPTPVWLVEEPKKEVRFPAAFDDQNTSTVNAAFLLNLLQWCIGNITLQKLHNNKGILVSSPKTSRSFPTRI